MLTGSAATHALQLYSRLGAMNARFDARKVARDVLSRNGRSRLMFALARAIGRFGMIVRKPRPRSHGIRARRAGSARSRSRSADRPDPSPDATVPVDGRTDAPRGV